MWTEESITQELNNAVKDLVPLPTALLIAKEVRKQALIEIDSLITERNNLEAAATLLDQKVQGLTAQVQTLTSQNSNLTTVNQTLSSTNQTLQQQVAALQVQVADLKQRLYLATRPSADAYITVDRSVKRINRFKQCLSIVTNTDIWDNRIPIVQRMAPFTNALYEQVSFHFNGGFGLSDVWDWDGVGTKPPAPHNFGNLDKMARTAAMLGSNFMFYLWAPSWHMKRSRGTKLTASEKYAPEKGRLAGESKGEWRILVRDCFVRVANILLKAHPNALLDTAFYQEFKGMWELLDKDQVVKGQNWADGQNPGTPGYGDIDTVPLYELTIEGVMDAIQILQIPTSRVRFGAPYAVMQSKGMRDVDALPVGHPLADRPWGTMSKAPVYAIERCIRDIKAKGLPFNYGVLDGGTNNRDRVFPAQDPFAILEKIHLSTKLVADTMQANGYADYEVVWAERYLCETPLPGETHINAQQDAPERRILFTLSGLCGMAWHGAGRTFQWGYRGEDGGYWPNDQRNENGAQFTANGDPTPMYDMMLKFKQAFPAGCNLYPIQIEGDPALDGLGTDGKMVVYNKTFVPKTFAVGMKTYTLPPSGWAIVDA